MTLQPKGNSVKKLLLSSLLVAASAVAAVAQEPSRVVTVVTSPDPQTQLMSMVLTLQAAQQGAEAHILLCGPAGDLALRDAPESATAGQPPRDMSPQGLMQMIRENTGATVEVCAIYLPGRGEDASVLLDGVGVADPAEMAGRLMAPEARVLSF
jgi:predicted peroxiredoxin